MTDYLQNIGQFSWMYVWTPVLLWTVLALLVAIVMKRVKLHPTSMYYANLGVLFLLPLTIVATAVYSLLELNLLSQFIGEEVAAGFSYVAFLPDIVVSMEHQIKWPLLISGISMILIAMYGSVAVIALLVSFIRLSYSGSAMVEASDERDKMILKDIAEKSGIRRQIRLFRSASTGTPYTYGFYRPVIVLPDTPIEHDSLLAILMHEVNHIRRNDFLMHSFEMFVVQLFRFHPMVGHFHREVHRYRELSCDAEVLSSGRINRSGYATVLLEFVSAQPKPVMSAALSMATQPSRIKERIQFMQLYSHSVHDIKRARKHGLIILSMLFAGMIGLVACTDSAFNSRGADQIVSPDLSDSEARSAYLQQSMQGADSVVHDYEEEVFLVVEKMPEPIGGMQAIYENIRYPELARRAGIEGRVVVQFIVDEEGNVVNPTVIRGIGGGCDEAAIAAVRDVKFIPGMQRGRNVKVQFQLPIVFRLNNDT